MVADPVGADPDPDTTLEKKIGSWIRQARKPGSDPTLESKPDPELMKFNIDFCLKVKYQD